MKRCSTRIHQLRICSSDGWSTASARDESGVPPPRTISTARMAILVYAFLNFLFALEPLRVSADYDIFLSHAWKDGERPQQIADALTEAGLRVWFDAAEIDDFASITRAVTEGLAKSKALLAYYSAAYPRGVFWLRAYGNDDAKAALGPEAREALRADQMRAMAERLGIDAHGLTPEQIEGALARKIASENKDCLWVVDDMPNGLDGEALRRWFAPHALARTLITTRSREYGSLAQGIDLSVLTPDEAFQLLTSQRKPAGKDEEGQARELANA